MILKGTFRAWSALVVARLYRRRRLLHKVMQRWRSVMQTLRHDRRMWYLAVRHHHHTIVRRTGMACVVWLDAILTSCVLCCVRVHRSPSASLRSHDGDTRNSLCSAAAFASDLLACLRPRHDRSPYYVLDVTIRCRPMVATRDPGMQLPPCRPQAAVHHST